LYLIYRAELIYPIVNFTICHIFATLKYPTKLHRIFLLFMYAIPTYESISPTKKATPMAISLFETYVTQLNSTKTNIHQFTSILIPTPRACFVARSTSEFLIPAKNREQVECLLARLHSSGYAHLAPKTRLS
jgi:hypothetical protein